MTHKQASQHPGVGVFDPKESIDSASHTPDSTHNCPQCGQPLTCEIANGKSDCWCFQIEAKTNASEVSENEQCLCLECLNSL
jgi:hypothetical protein